MRKVLERVARESTRSARRGAVSIVSAGRVSTCEEFSGTIDPISARIPLLLRELSA
jgi:hypothetical protein